jgi:anaerobic magnesium-protoporphyrin IX monomethyl ester cyclase
LADKPIVLLLNPPGDKLYIRDYYCSFSSKADYYWPPQDLIYLSGLLNGRFDVRVLDAIAARQSPESVFEDILALDPAAVVFTTGTATIKTDAALMARLKSARPAIRIVASAGILKFVGKEILETRPEIDALLLDFGENDLSAYLRSLEKPSRPRKRPPRRFRGSGLPNLFGPDAPP